MKLKLILLVLILVIVYLNRMYASIYDFLKEQNLKPPSTQTTYYLVNDKNRQSIKFVTLGDSLSAGVGSKLSEQTLPYLIAQKLSQKTQNITLINLAVPGARSNHVLTTQLPQALKEKPDYVSLLLGINDIHGSRPESEFNQNLTSIIDQLINKTNAQIILINIPFLGSPSLIHEPYRSFFDLKTRQFNRSISKFCNSKRIICVDLYTPTKIKFSQTPSFYSSDQFHPSEKGYLMWAKLINAN